MNERSFETLLYKITANVVQKIMETTGWLEDDAMMRFTQSKLYSYLEIEETKVFGITEEELEESEEVKEESDDNVSSESE